MLFLTKSELQKIVKYQYVSVGDSIFTPWFTPFWRTAFRFVPSRTSPNTITTIGFLASLTCGILTAVYSPNLDGNAPRWFFVFAAFSIVWHSTLDALDGMQCRKTNKNGPLELLFDHGCDAVTSCFFFLASSVAFRYGNDPYLCMFTLFFGQITFFSVQWRYFVTGNIRFRLFDVTELQYTVACVLLATAYYGEGIWMYKVPFTEVSYSQASAFCAIASGIYSTAEHLMAIFKEKTSIRPASTFFFGLILIALCLDVLLPVLKSAHMFYYLALTAGIFTAKQSIRILVACLVRKEPRFLDSSLIPVFIMFSATQFVRFGTGIFDIASIVALSSVVAALDLSVFFVGVTIEIANFYKLGVFCITKGDDDLWETLKHN